jgi:predicted O-methyltransferase YrrM
MTAPLVSCLMPTYNRRPFIAHAIAYYLRQTYENRELIVLDDGDEAIGDLIPDDRRIRYERLPRKITLGAKLNLGSEMAQGDLIAHFDDDDWYAPWRLAYQVDALLRDRTDLCGINQLLYYDLRNATAFEYRYPAEQKTWLLGSDLLYTKSYWSTHRFADIDVGMDLLFSWGAERSRITVLDDRDFAVHMIHATNVSPKQTAGAYWHPHQRDDIARAMGEDWAFYQRCDRGAGHPSARLGAPLAHTARVSPAAEPKPLRNVFACLVHERPECVIDLVSNLRRLDPQSRILLYDGGADGKLLDPRLPWACWGVEIHPTPRPMQWGCLHDFALDCLRHLRSTDAFDVVTIVDSDQLALRAGYSDFLARRLGDRDGLGLLSSAPERQGAQTTIPPCVTAHQEIALWRPFLRRFPDGEEKFAHWTFWPATVIAADAGTALLEMFDRDRDLAEIMRASRLWATEEILFPTLAALLGFRIERNPCIGDFVKYRAAFVAKDVETALRRPDAYWMHPVTRQYADPARARIRAAHDDYRGTPAPGATPPAEPLLSPILRRVRAIEGWLEDEEAEVLAVAARELLSRDATPKRIVEIGSYCGKATALLAALAQACSPQSRVLAIDTFDGVVGALDSGLVAHGPTLAKFKQMLAEAGASAQVDISVGRACDALCDQPIDLILVDGLHDYASVAQDFHAFAAKLAPGALAAFHDYAPYFPGVRRFVDELLADGAWEEERQAGSMIILRRAGVVPAVSGTSVQLQATD